MGHGFNGKVHYSFVKQLGQKNARLYKDWMYNKEKVKTGRQMETGYSNYVFDVNTVFQENLTLALRYLDKLKLMKYTASGKNPLLLRDKFELMLERIEGKGVKRAVILENWLSGKISGSVGKARVLEYIKSQIQEGTKNNTSLYLMMDICHLTFTSDILCEILQINKNVLRTIQRLVKEGKRVYIVGNVDINTYRLLKRKHAEVFRMFSGEYVSGETGLIKPEREFYEKMISNLGLNPFVTYIVEENMEDLEKCRQVGLSCGPSV